MNLLEPSLKFAPGARVVYSSLYDSTDPAMLTQDLLMVSLAGDTFVDVTWAPEHDPDGCFYVTVLRQYSELISTTCRNPYRAIELVEEFAKRFSERFNAVSCSSSEITTVDFPFRPAA